MDQLPQQFISSRIACSCGLPRCANQIEVSPAYRGVVVRGLYGRGSEAGEILLVLSPDSVRLLQRELAEALACASCEEAEHGADGPG